jgi:hypothetical protein
MLHVLAMRAMASAVLRMRMPCQVSRSINRIEENVVCP